MLNKRRARRSCPSLVVRIPTFLSKSIWLIMLVSTITLVFLLLQCRYPYYFLQDDNRSFFLPMYVHNYRSILNGEFPLYNFHQFLGSPVLANSQSGALYPFTYISVFLSKIIFGHYLAAIDIYVYLHLVIAVVGFFFMLRSLEIDNQSAFFGAITWTLSSFVIYVSNSWVFISAFAALFPITIYFGIRLYRNLNLGNLMSLVACQTLLFYIGSPQYFIYTIFFEYITLIPLMIVERKERQDEYTLTRILKYFVLGLICTFILCLPLLLPSYCQMEVCFSRGKQLPYTDYVGWRYSSVLLINSLIKPFIKIPNSFMHLDNLAHIGYLTLIFVGISLGAVFGRKVTKQKLVHILIFYFICVIAYIWAMGGVIAKVIYLFPILNRMHSTSKIVFFANFYIIILSVIGFRILMENRSRKDINILFIMFMIIHIANFLSLYLFMPQQVFGMYMDRVPVEDQIDRMFGDNRIITLDIDISTVFRDEIIAANQATLRDIYHFSGYIDPLLPEENYNSTLKINRRGIYEDLDTIPFDYFRTWGVKWYITGANGIPSEYRGNLMLKYEDERRKIYYDPECRPMVYWHDNIGDEGIEYEINTNFVRIVTNSKMGRNLSINFLYHPFFKAFIDGKETAVSKSECGQMTVSIPLGQHDIVVKYCDPYFILGCYMASGLLIILIVYRIWKSLSRMRYMQFYSLI